MIEIMTGASIREELEARLKEVQENIDKLKSQTEKWTQSVHYKNSLNVLATEIKRMPEEAMVLVAEDYGEYETEKKKAKETSDMLNMFYVQASRCTDENGSKYFVVYLSKI